MGCFFSEDNGYTNVEEDVTVYDGNTAIQKTTCAIHKVSVEEYDAGIYQKDYVEGDLVTTGKLSIEDAFKLKK